MIIHKILTGAQYSYWTIFLHSLGATTIVSSTLGNEKYMVYK
jgi:hypothetical protein